jgi:hypothetical protein
MTDDITRCPQAQAAFRRAGVGTPSEERYGYLLEIFKVGDGTALPNWQMDPRRHAVWLHCLKTGGWRWSCCCGASRAHNDLDIALLVEARAHFDRPWKPAAVPLGHPSCLWNDRVTGARPPSTTALKQLVRKLRREAADVTPIRPPPQATVEVVHLCGICGETFRIADDDSHWTTGRGPFCPTKETP